MFLTIAKCWDANHCIKKRTSKFALSYLRVHGFYLFFDNKPIKTREKLGMGDSLSSLNFF